MQIPLKKCQHGLSLILSIFILVVLALLAAAMLNILSVGAGSVAREVISTRALFVAESGAQVKLNQIFPPGSVASALAQCLAVDNTIGLAGIDGCSNLSVVVECDGMLVDSEIYYTITSTGSCGPVGEQAIRVTEVRAKGA